jgi:hypothetical protein
MRVRFRARDMLLRNPFLWAAETSYARSLAFIYQPSASFGAALLPP